MQRRRTVLSTIVEAEEEVEEEEVEEEEAEEFPDNQVDAGMVVMDLSIPVDKRVSSLVKYFEVYGVDGVELINKICTMYQFSGTRVLREFVENISTNTSIEAEHRLRCAMTLVVFEGGGDGGCERSSKVLLNVCQYISDHQTTSIFNTTELVSAVKVLMTCPETLKAGEDIFHRILSNPSHPPDFRYKTVLSLERPEPVTYKEFPDGVLIRALDVLCELPKPFPFRYRILAAQYLLTLTDSWPRAEEILILIARDSTVTVRVRADAADTLMNCAKNEESRDTGREIIRELGMAGVRRGSVFDNQENVHTTEIQRSTCEILEALWNDVDLDERMTPEFCERYVYTLVDPLNETVVRDGKVVPRFPNNKLLCDLKRVQEVTISMNRIAMDRMLFTTRQIGMSTVLAMVIAYILGSSDENKRELDNRLVEELVDMSGTCSTGYVTRLVNVLATYYTAGIRISFRDQLIANVLARFNLKLREWPEVDEVLEEMANDETANQDSRPYMTRFVLKNIANIRQELYLEFRDHLPDSQFDTYFREGVIRYETGDE